MLKYSRDSIIIHKSLRCGNIYVCILLWIKKKSLWSDIYLVVGISKKQSLMTYLFIILLFLTGKSVLLWQRGVDVLTAQSLMVSPDHRYKLLADHTLEIRNIKPSDGGDYACKISVLGDPIEIKHTLEILRKPFLFLLFF